MKPLEGNVRDLSHDGRGVVQVDGKIYFVEGALPGERIGFIRKKYGRKFESGVLKEILEASEDRVNPQCEYFGTCGGCALQHYSTAAQIDHKHRALLESLHRLGNVSPKDVLAPVSGPVLEYRRKARLGVWRAPKSGEISIGFRKQKKTDITSVKRCIALHPEISALLPALHKLIGKLNCAARVKEIEVACGDNSVALVFHNVENLSETDLELFKQFQLKLGARIYFKSGTAGVIKSIMDDENPVLTYGLPEQKLTLEFSPADFVQVNAGINRKLVDLGVRLLEPDKEDTVLELFCGMGNFSLPIARRVREVVAIESNHELIARADTNAVKNNIENIKFRVGDLYHDDITNLGKLGKFTKLFLDPPRNGAIEVMRHLVPLIGPERIVYVSCNPSTLARDSKILCHTHGYKLDCAGVVDMFPHTAHVESIAVFSR